jgi:hypothetical protein
MQLSVLTTLALCLVHSSLALPQGESFLYTSLLAGSREKLSTSPRGSRNDFEWSRRRRCRDFVDLLGSGRNQLGWPRNEELSRRSGTYFDFIFGSCDELGVRKRDYSKWCVWYLRSRRRSSRRRIEVRIIIFAVRAFLSSRRSARLIATDSFNYLQNGSFQRRGPQWGVPHLQIR